MVTEDILLVMDPERAWMEKDGHLPSDGEHGAQLITHDLKSLSPKAPMRTKLWLHNRGG